MTGLDVLIVLAIAELCAGCVDLIFPAGARLWLDTKIRQLRKLELSDDR